MCKGPVVGNCLVQSRNASGLQCSQNGGKWCEVMPVSQAPQGLTGGGRKLPDSKGAPPKDVNQGRDMLRSSLSTRLSGSHLEKAAEPGLKESRQRAKTVAWERERE